MTTFRIGNGLAAVALVLIAQTAGGSELQRNNDALLEQLRTAHDLSATQSAAVRAIFDRSEFIGQGNPTVTRHPLDPEQCRARSSQSGVPVENPEFRRICGALYMAPLYDPSKQTPADATTCIDQFEFPNIPCTYPVVWVKAREAAQICSAVGKRMCDAHEWEGACAGALEPPDYRFELARGVDPSQGIRRMRKAHNDADHPVWAYGASYRKGVCATSSAKSPGCDGGGWKLCGSNTFPSGSFPQCRSRLGVYDLHGNAAEHMNLPLVPEQMSMRGSTELGYTEMKGSWFVFDQVRAHEDACRWRAPFWHGTRVMDPKSHHNYHLGFRCCADVKPSPPKVDAAPAHPRRQ